VIVGFAVTVANQTAQVVTLAERLQPVLGAAFGSAAGGIPGFGAATTLFVNSVTSGAANAFLTLRVGIIAKQYCRALVVADRRSIRRTAVMQATQLLGNIVFDSTKHVAAAVGTATRRTVGETVESFGDELKKMGLEVRDKSVAVLARRRLRPDGPPILEIQPQD